ncbi:MAG: protein kinase [bacterium]
MLFENPSELRQRIESFTQRPLAPKVPILEDTSEYMAIQTGMVLRLEGNDYYVTGDAREGRFGINEQPKFWVKYAIDLTTAERKVIKLVFYEECSTRLGRFLLRCSRSPEKESAILEIVRGHPLFMQGVTVRDAKGNTVRILDNIHGESLFSYVVDIRQPHEEYFFETFPGLLRCFIPCIDAIRFLHERGQHHGDIRNDHVLIENGSGLYRWIDFDYQVDYPEYDLWSMGNILIYVVGKGIHPIRTALQDPSRYPSKAADLTSDDAMVFYPYRVANLKKLYPYIPVKLNEVLLRFSNGARDTYKDFQSQMDDLQEALSLMSAGSPTPV